MTNWKKTMMASAGGAGAFFTHMNTRNTGVSNQYEGRMTTVEDDGIYVVLSAYNASGSASPELYVTKFDYGATPIWQAAFPGAQTYSMVAGIHHDGNNTLIINCQSKLDNSGTLTNYNSIIKLNATTGAVTSATTGETTGNQGYTGFYLGGRGYSLYSQANDTLFSASTNSSGRYQSTTWNLHAYDDNTFPSTGMHQFPRMNSQNNTANWHSGGHYMYQAINETNDRHIFYSEAQDPSNNGNGPQLWVSNIANINTTTAVTGVGARQLTDSTYADGSKPGGLVLDSTNGNHVFAEQNHYDPYAFRIQKLYIGGNSAPNYVDQKKIQSNTSGSTTGNPLHSMMCESSDGNSLILAAWHYEYEYGLILMSIDKSTYTTNWVNHFVREGATTDGLSASTIGTSGGVSGLEARDGFIYLLAGEESAWFTAVPEDGSGYGLFDLDGYQAGAEIRYQAFNETFSTSNYFLSSSNTLINFNLTNTFSFANYGTQNSTQLVDNNFTSNTSVSNYWV